MLGPFRLCLLLITLAGCTPRLAAVGETRVADADGALFAAVLGELVRDSTGGDLRVDPRPLRPDPSLVVLEDVGAPAGRIAPETWKEPLLGSAEGTIRHRESVLASLKYTIADGLHPPRCPGALLAPSPEKEVLRLQFCPGTPYRIVMMATPRAGGIFWPGNRDERSEYTGRNVVSVRVIVTHMTPSGRNQVAMDFVFERKGQDWVFLKSVVLGIAE